MFWKNLFNRIKVTCPKCGRILSGATREMIGDIGICPKCKAEFIISGREGTIVDSRKEKENLFYKLGYKLGETIRGTSQFHKSTPVERLEKELERIIAFNEIKNTNSTTQFEESTQEQIHSYGTKNLKLMKNPIPEDFGLTCQEYSSIATKRNDLQKEIDKNQSSKWELFIQNSLMAFYGTAFLGVLIWALTGIVQIMLKPLFSDELRFYLTSGMIICIGLSLFVYVLIEPKLKRKKLNELFANPDYHKVKLYEEAYRSYEESKKRYELKQERYWTSLRGVAFEKELANLYTDMGYSVEQTKGSGDEGIDLIIQKDNKKIIVQCKGHEKPIGVAAIRDLYGVIMHTRVEKGILACPIGFTDGVKKFAEGKPIELISSKELIEMAKSVPNKY